MFSEIQVAWAQVSSFADPLFVIIDTPTITAALSRLQADKLDGYVLFILEFIRNNGVFQIITGDGGFATVPIIQVFTINRKVIQAARDADLAVR